MKPGYGLERQPSEQKKEKMSEEKVFILFGRKNLKF